MVQSQQTQQLSVIPGTDSTIKSVQNQYCSATHVTTEYILCHPDCGNIQFTPHFFGENKIVVTLSNNRKDTVIFNATPEIKVILCKRLNYLSSISYSGPDGKVPFSFRPLSVQGESLGKMNFILQMLLVDKDIPEARQRIQQVEQSAVHYVKNKWFTNGDFNRPAESPQV
ncbi:TPA: hypothetical protein PCO36_004754 [Klebsiella oxytoca]|nr:hypothetical protein [Klebsiella oxytoca]